MKTMLWATVCACLLVACGDDVTKEILQAAVPTSPTVTCQPFDGNGDPKEVSIDDIAKHPDRYCFDKHGECFYGCPK